MALITTPFLSLVMIDIVDWETAIGPTHIVTNMDDYNHIDIAPIFVGKAPELDIETFLEHGIDTEVTYVGLYVRGIDYESINHNLIYVLIHNPYVDRLSLRSMKGIIKETVGTNKHVKNHVHLIMEGTDLGDITL